MPGEHPDDLTAMRAEGGVSTDDRLDLAELGVVAPMHVVVEHEEA